MCVGGSMPKQSDCNKLSKLLTSDAGRRAFTFVLRDVLNKVKGMHDQMINMAANGIELIKHGKTGKPHSTVVSLHQNKGTVEWSGKTMNKKMQFNYLRSVTKGKTAEAFKTKKALDLKDEVCLSLEWDDRSLSFQASDKVQRDSFYWTVLAVWDSVVFKSQYITVHPLVLPEDNFNALSGFLETFLKEAGLGQEGKRNDFNSVVSIMHSAQRICARKAVSPTFRARRFSLSPFASPHKNARKMPVIKDPTIMVNTTTTTATHTSNTNATISASSIVATPPRGISAKLSMSPSLKSRNSRGSLKMAKHQRGSLNIPSSSPQPVYILPYTFAQEKLRSQFENVEPSFWEEYFWRLQSSPMDSPDIFLRKPIEHDSDEEYDEEFATLKMETWVTQQLMRFAPIMWEWGVPKRTIKEYMKLMHCSSDLNDHTLLDLLIYVDHLDEKHTLKKRLKVMKSDTTRQVKKMQSKYPSNRRWSSLGVVDGRSPRKGSRKPSATTIHEAAKLDEIFPNTV